MKTKESIYNDVVIDFYDDIKNQWTIDTWKTDDDNEEGVVVGRINLKGEIIWEVEEAKNDPLVLKEIEFFFDNRLFSIKDSDTIVDEICKIFMNSCRTDSESWDIVSKDGVTTYGYEKKELMDNLSLIVGMFGNENYKIFGVDEEDMKQASQWLVEDIATAVGEEYVIEFH